MIVVLMGVSGSGKTVVGEALATRLNWAFEDADHWHSAANIQKMRRGVALTDADPEPWLRSLNGAVRKWSAVKHDVAWACSALRESYRELLAESVDTPEYIRFVNRQGHYEDTNPRMDIRAG